MAEKQVRVVINGEETVSNAAKKAEGGLSEFVNSAKGMLTGLAAVAAGVALGEFFKKAIEEAQNSREAMGQLAVSVDNSGASFDKMRPQIEATLDKLASMTKFQDDDFARAMQQMTLKTGDAKWALNNLGQAADLAAAANIPLEESAAALAKAHEGNTKALFKLVPDLKGAANWQDMLAQSTHGAAAAQMKQLGPIAAIQKQFGEFAEAVGRALMSNDEFSTTGFKVADMLANLGHWIDANRGELGKFIDVVVSVAKNLWESLTPAFELLGKVAGPILKVIAGLLAEAGFSVRALSVVWQSGVGMMLEAVGWLVSKGAAVLKKFGVDVGEGVGDAISKAGGAMRTEAATRWDAMATDHAAFWAKMTADAEKGALIIKSNSDSSTRHFKDNIEEQNKAWDKYLAQYKKSIDEFNRMTKDWEKQIQTLGPAIADSMKTTHVDNMNAAFATAQKSADDLWKKIRESETLPKLDTTKQDVLNLSGSLSDAAGDVLVIGDNFGLVDEKARKIITSVQDISSSLTDALTKSGTSAFLGWTGVIGGLLTIAEHITGGDSERRALLRSNNVALDKLRTEGVSLSTKASGETISKAQQALTPEAISQLLAFNNPSQQLKWRADNNPLTMLDDILARTGLRFSDLERIAGDVGLNLKDKNNNVNFDAIAQLADVIKRQGFGTVVSQSFSDQFAFRKENDRLSGYSNKDTATDLISFLRDQGNVSAFQGINTNDPTLAIQQLLGLRTRMNNGGLGATDMGKLSGAEFLKQISELIDMLSAAGGTGTRNGATSGSPAPGGADTTGLIANAMMEPITGPITAQGDAAGAYYAKHLTIASQHLDEARIHTGLLTTVANNTDVLLKVAAVLVPSGGNEAIDAILGRRVQIDRRLSGAATL